jgi:hypothetical protein
VKRVEKYHLLNRKVKPRRKFSMFMTTVGARLETRKISVSGCLS